MIHATFQLEPGGVAAAGIGYAGGMRTHMIVVASVLCVVGVMAMAQAQPGGRRSRGTGSAGGDERAGRGYVVQVRVVEVEAGEDGGEGGVGGALRLLRETAQGPSPVLAEGEEGAAVLKGVVADLQRAGAAIWSPTLLVGDGETGMVQDGSDLSVVEWVTPEAGGTAQVSRRRLGRIVRVGVREVAPGRVRVALECESGSPVSPLSPAVGLGEEGEPTDPSRHQGQEILIREIQTTYPQWVGTTVVLAAPSWRIGERETYVLVTVLED